MLTKQPMRPRAGITVYRSKRCAVKVRVVCGADLFVWPGVDAIGDVPKTLIGFRGTDLSGFSKGSTCEEHRLEEWRDANRR